MNALYSDVWVDPKIDQTMSVAVEKDLKPEYIIMTQLILSC